MKIHLDTDIGGDIDDLCALAMLLASPGVDLTGVTTVVEEGGRRCGYARYTLRLAGRQDVPVAAGADVSLGCYRLRPGYPDEAAYWPESVPPSPNPLEAALELLRHSIEQGATVVAIGPSTNLALLDQRWPGLLDTAPLYLMGFHLNSPPAGFPAWGAETDYNVQMDTDSAARMVQAHAPTVIPLEMTVQTALRRAHLPRLRQGGPLGELIARQAEAFARDEHYEARYGQACAGLPDDTINFLHDPLACAVALNWGGARIETIPLRAELRQDGQLHAVRASDGTPVRVVTVVDAPRFNEWWCGLVAGETPNSSTTARERPSTG
ncbi:MAG: nucleoside hydrolase [Chloroflexota bacterium]